MGLNLASQVTSFKLSNGMTWLLVYRPKIPVFSGMVMVRAGGADEVNGKTGLAHIFEHMAFKGSKEIGTKNFAKEAPILKEIAKVGRAMSEEMQKEKPDPKIIQEDRQKIQELTQEENKYVVKNQVWETLSRNGAEDLNAFTSKDATGFHASMPVTKFPLWAHLFSQMVFEPVMREFYQERDVVMEERRLRYDNSPQGYLFEEMIKTAFPSGPYSWSPIGHVKDLVGLTMEDAENFHKHYYTPSNITGVLVGDITLSTAKTELEKTFGKYSGPARQKEPVFPDSSFQGEKRKTIFFPAEPYLVMAYHKPKAPSQQDYIFDILDNLLCEGRTGRLYQKLVKEERIASSINCTSGFPGSRGDNLFVIMAEPIKGNSLETLEKSIEDEIEVMVDNLKQSELEKVREAVLYYFVWDLENNMQLAEQLSSAQAILKDWRYVANYTKVIQSITSDEIEKTIKKYFTKDNRVVVYRLRGKR
ncbi:MAG: insulinase family protein [Deltaproteobacteria bacterium]|nr:insulinase family protein [Deltaproteobacteria bacterium]